MYNYVFGVQGTLVPFIINRMMLDKSVMKAHLKYIFTYSELPRHIKPTPEYERKSLHC